MNRRTLGIVVSVLLAAAGTWVIVNYVRGADERVLEGQETVEVLVVDAPVARGTPAEDLTDLVRTVRVPAASVAVGAVSDLSSLADRVASVDLIPGEELVSSRFVTADSLSQALDVDVPAELLEVTVELSPERVLGGELDPGDLVAVVASFQPFTLDAVEPEGTDNLQDFIEDPAVDGEAALAPLRTPNTTHIIVQKVLVTNIQFGSAPPVSDTASTTDGAVVEEPNVSPTGSLLVTVALTAPDVEKVVFTAEFGTLWLARETAESGEGGIQIQTRGTIYL